MKCLVSKISDVAQLLRQGSLCVTDLVEASLKRQQTIAPLNAFITTTPARARQHALYSREKFNKGESRSMLEGVPIAIKDNFCISGIRTTCGSVMLKDYVPPYTASIVQRLQSAGAIVVGKTNLDEFAMGSGTVDSAFGPTKNIYKSGLNCSICNNIKDSSLTNTSPSDQLTDGDWLVAGGSSGGSAVAVASGVAFAAIGSDTGGSVRLPASYCGVVGYKPSYGTISRYGLISLVNSMDTPGIFARTADDITDVFRVICGHDTKDSTSITYKLNPEILPAEPSLEGVVVGIPSEYHCEGISPQIIDAWTSVADKMENAGAQVRRVSLPHTQDSITCYSILNQVEVASNFTRYTGLQYGLQVQHPDSMEGTYAQSRAAGLSEVVRGRILAGNFFLLQENKSKYYEKALKVRRLIKEDFENVWGTGVQLLLTPTTLTTAPRFSEFSIEDNITWTCYQDIFTKAANMAGISAVSVPVCHTVNGLPLSLQLLAPHMADSFLLSCAKWLQQNSSFTSLNVYD